MWEFIVLIGERIPKNSHVSFFSFLWDLNFLVSFAVFLIKKKELGIVPYVFFFRLIYMGFFCLI